MRSLLVLLTLLAPPVLAQDTLFPDIALLGDRVVQDAGGTPVLLVAVRNNGQSAATVVLECSLFDEGSGPVGIVQLAVRNATPGASHIGEAKLPAGVASHSCRVIDVQTPK